MQLFRILFEKNVSISVAVFAKIIFLFVSLINVMKHFQNLHENNGKHEKSTYYICQFRSTIIIFTNAIHSTLKLTYDIFNTPHFRDNFVHVYISNDINAHLLPRRCVSTREKYII